MKFRSMLLVIVLLCISALLMGAQEPTGMIGWETVLVWLTTPSGVVAVLSILPSLATEYLGGTWYHTIDAKWKQLIFFVMSLLIPVSGVALGILTVDWPFMWEPFWFALQAGAMGFTGGTLFHAFVPIRKSA